MTGCRGAVRRSVLLAAALTMWLCALGSAAAFADSDLGVSKAGPASVTAGADMTYTIDVVNTGPDGAAGVRLDDTLPAGTTFVSLVQDSGPAASCTTPAPGDPGTVTCARADLANGAALSFSLTVRVDAGAQPGSVFTNVANVTTTSFDPDSSDNSSSATTSVTATADLSVTKTGPESTAPGADMTYTIDVVNTGPDGAADVQLDDTLPAGTTFVSLVQDSGPAASCTTPAPGDPGTVTCARTALANGAEMRFSLTVRVDAGAQPGTFFTNVANVTTPSLDPNEENNSSSSTAFVAQSAIADLAITKSGPTAATPGGDIAYDLELTNAGPDAAAGATLNDTLPGTLTFAGLEQQAGPAMSCTTPAVGAGGTVTCSIASLPSGSTVRLRLTAQVPADTASGTEFTNTVTASSSTFDPNEENNSSTLTTTVSQADLAMTKTAPASAVAGTEVSYRLSVSNTGPDPAEAVVTDTLPADTTFVSLTQDSGPAFAASTPGSGQGGTAFANGTLPAGSTATFTLVVRLDAAIPGGTNVTNTATATSEAADPDSGNNSSSATTSVTAAPADLSVTKTGPAEALPGATMSYTVGVANAGPGPSGLLVLSDPLPASTRFVSATQTAGPPLTLSTPPAGSSGTVTASGTLATGQAAELVITVTVGADAAAGSTITNTASVATSATDPDPADDSASASTTVVAPPPAEPPPPDDTPPPAGDTTPPPGGDTTPPPGDAPPAPGDTTPPPDDPSPPVVVRPSILSLERRGDRLVVRIDPGSTKATAALSVRTGSRAWLRPSREFVTLAAAPRVKLDPAKGNRTVRPRLTSAGAMLLEVRSSLTVVVRVTPEGGRTVKRKFALPGRG